MQDSSGHELKNVKMTIINVMQACCGLDLVKICKSTGYSAKANIQVVQEKLRGFNLVLMP